MRKPRIRTLSILALCLVLILAVSARAQEEDAEPVEQVTTDVQEDKPKINNLPQNFKGFTGLLLTTATRTLAPGTVEIGGAYKKEEGTDPDYTRTTRAFNVGVGVPGHVEFALHVPYVETNLFFTERIDEFGLRVRDFERKKSSDFGSIEVAVKWAFAQQSLFLPALAGGLGFIAPTGDYTQRISQVKAYGIKPFVAMGVELNDLFFTDYSPALLADGALVIRDVGVGQDREYEEKHGEVHFGIVMPLCPRNYVTLIGEYEGILMKGTTNEEDENSFLGALRLTTQHIHMSAGAQYTLIEARDMDERITYIISLSYKIGPPYPLFP